MVIQSLLSTLSLVFHSEEFPEYVCAEDFSWSEVGTPGRSWSVEELTDALDLMKVRYQIALNIIDSLERDAHIEKAD